MSRLTKPDSLKGESFTLTACIYPCTDTSTTSFSNPKSVRLGPVVHRHQSGTHSDGTILFPNRHPAMPAMATARPTTGKFFLSHLGLAGALAEQYCCGLTTPLSATPSCFIPLPTPLHGEPVLSDHKISVIEPAYLQISPLQTFNNSQRRSSLSVRIMASHFF